MVVQSKMITFPLNQKLSGEVIMNGRLIGIDARVCWDGCELEFVVSEKGLVQFVDILRGGEYGLYMLEMEGGRSCSPKNNFAYMEVGPSEEKLLLAVTGGRVIVTGDKEVMRLLSDNLDYLRSQWRKGGSQHMHFDPLSNPFLFSPSSESFVVSPEVFVKIN